MLGIPVTFLHSLDRFALQFVLDRLHFTSMTPIVVPCTFYISSMPMS